MAESNRLPPEALVAEAEMTVTRLKAAEPRGWGWHVTAAYLMRAWARTVDEIAGGTYHEHTLIEEYVNDLGARVLLDRVLAASRPEARRELLAWLEPLDARFEAATTRAVRPVGGSPDLTSAHATPRWYWRVPKAARGTLASDLAERGLA